ncbi:MAG: hypothetical protein VB877_02325 [Pirellulaceae bacterium]
MRKHAVVIPRSSTIQRIGLLLLLMVTMVTGPGCRPAKPPSVAAVPADPQPKDPPVPGKQQASPVIRWDNHQVEMQRLERAIQLATDYMVRACDEEGRFDYLGHLDPDVKIYPEYNIVRHAGAMMGLAVAHQFKPRDTIRQALLRADSFLKKNSFGQVEDQPDMLAVWSRPEVTFVKREVRAKLGSAGLSLVSLAQLEAIAPGTTSREDLRKLANFILFMQKVDGSFYAYYVPSKGGRVESADAMYFAGEAALGLVMLYALDPDPRWLESAGKAMRYLAISQVDKIPTYPDQWVLQAMARWLPRIEKTSLESSRQQIMKHVVRICRDMLADQDALQQDPRIAGCFTHAGITCSTGTCLEGLLGVLECLPDEQRLLKEQIGKGATAGVHFLMKSQVRHGPYAGAWTFITPLLSPDDARLSATFRTQAEEVRIDYVQHPLCALIRYHQLQQRGVISAPPRR